ncbi:MAG: hypothetical protein EXS31_08710 [Pedosphaera sp.]|nr:hypothetical protein [Pedosphaera sp.]
MKPLAFICLENSVVGSQLVNRLMDLGYQPQSVSDISQLASQAKTGKPFVIVCSLVSKRADVLQLIREMRADEATKHIPVIGVTPDLSSKFHSDAVAAGATLVVVESGVLAQLPQLLDAALAVD